LHENRDLTEAEAKQEVPNNRGLFKAIRGALTQAGFGDKLKPTKRPKREFKEPNPDLDWVWLAGGVREIIEREWDLPKIATQIPSYILSSELADYKKAAGILNEVIIEIEARIQGTPHEKPKKPRACQIH
jgi:hypothetical protein